MSSFTSSFAQTLFSIVFGLSWPADQELRFELRLRVNSMSSRGFSAVSTVFSSTISTVNKISHPPSASWKISCNFCRHLTEFSPLKEIMSRIFKKVFYIKKKSSIVTIECPARISNFGKYLWTYLYTSDFHYLELIVSHWVRKLVRNMHYQSWGSSANPQLRMSLYRLKHALNICLTVPRCPNNSPLMNALWNLNSLYWRM